MATDASTAKEKRNFLAAYHTLKFSEANKDETEIADISRRCIALKYLTARQSESEDTAAHLLRKGLEDYQKLMENKEGVNNYCKQIKAQMQRVNNNPQNWKSGLNDVDVALNLIKPLPCQDVNTMPCSERLFGDGHVQNIIEMWKKADSSARQQDASVQAKQSLAQSPNVQSPNVQKRSRFVNSNQFDAKRPSSNSNSTDEDQVSYVKKQVSKAPSNQQNPFAQRSMFPSKSKLVKDSRSSEPVHRGNAKLKPPVFSQPSDEDCKAPRAKTSGFVTARTELVAQQAKSNKPTQKKTLGGKVSVNTQFVCPFKREQEKAKSQDMYNQETDSPEVEDERLKNIDPKMVELIKNEIMDAKAVISWDDIAGLEYAKKIIMEIVVYPMLRPDIFTGLRQPPKGILLFGPPGTGKTLIGKCIASQSKSTFFSISASSLTSKWIGEGEKMVRALFAVARVYQPSVIFVDEIDSLLTQRSETEHESSRRLKTEFLVQLDGAATGDEDRILIVGATNRPHELDEAARRRLVKRLYVPLPEFQARKQIINNLLLTVPHDLTEQDIDDVAEKSKGYSGADMSNLCKEASMGPVRSIPFHRLENISKEDVRHVTVDDFREALVHVRPSVSESSLSVYVEWDTIYGTGTAQNYKV